MTALTVFRIREEITDPDEIIVDRQHLLHRNVVSDGKRVGDLYLRRIERGRPEWLSFFDNSVDLAGIAVRTASLAGIFLLKRSDRLYAIVFGYGRTLLAEGVYDRRFGLRTTLNAVEPSKLRSIDHKRLDAISRHTRQQLSRSGGLEHFGLDIDRDLLRAVTGTPLDSRYGRRLSGADQLTVIADVSLSKLGDHLDLWSEVADETTYTVNFPWVDNVSDIQDRRLQLDLEKQLLKDLKKGSAICWLAPPEIIDWGATDGFAYRSRKKAEVYADIDLETYFLECGGPSSLSPEQLQHDRIFHHRADADAGRHSWSVLSCLVAEVTYKKRKFVLNEGIWYEVNSNFLQSIEDFFASIPQCALTFPRYADKDEGAYNARVAKGATTQFALLDRNLFRYPPRGTVEICDLFSSTKVFVHVKRGSGSATLSHLFAQGVVSAQLMLNETKFREQFLAKIPESFRWGQPSDAINPREFEICFAIVGRSGQSLSLPFFSKVSLKTAVQNLTQLGYRVSLAPIHS